MGFTAELDLKFFADEEFEPVKKLSALEQPQVIARNILRILMMGWTPSWKELLTPVVAQAIFWERKPEFLKEFRYAFQQGFLQLFKQLQGKTLNINQQEQVQLYLSNCLALLPYSDLTAYESIKIPQCIDEQWQLVEYRIKPIELTLGQERDADRVFAYGLEPLLHQQAQSHLIFMGTTYPAGQGFLTQVNSDSKGFETVGKSLYRTGRSRIQAWLAQQKGAIHVCGTSLGGSLSLLLAIDKGDYTLSRVDALNPAGLHDARSKSQFDHWDSLESKPQVVVQKQGNDPVSAFGLWKEDWNIIQVNPPAAKKGPNGLSDHALNYAGLKGTQFTPVDPKEDNLQRHQRNFWLYSLGRSFIYYGLLLPYTHLIRPLGHLLVKKWPVLLLLPVIFLVAHFAALGILAGIMLGIFTVALALTLTTAVQNILLKDTKPAYAKLHDPNLPRNKEMDLYDKDNALDMDLTYDEVNTYYKLMRLTKKKEFLPTEAKESKYVPGITKRDLLEASANPMNAKESVVFHVTKAKAGHIRHTLRLIEKLGVENQERLTQALEANYAEYALGKPKS